LYINEKVRPAETIPEIGKMGIKNDGRGDFNYDIF
jgi:hypothetical protein